MKAQRIFKVQNHAHGKQQCDTENCTREATIAGKCSPCYSALYYWQKKTISHRQKRKKQVAVFAARMAELTAGPHLKSVPNKRP